MSGRFVGNGCRSSSRIIDDTQNIGLFSQGIGIHGVVIDDFLYAISVEIEEISDSTISRTKLQIRRNGIAGVVRPTISCIDMGDMIIITIHEMGSMN